MKKVNLLTSILLATILCTSTSSILAVQLSVGPKLGTLGVGAEARVKLSDNIFARSSVNYFSYTHDLKAYKGALAIPLKLRLLTVPIVLDWHPFNESGFRLSAGVAYNGNRLDGNATPSKNITIKGINFTPKQIGKVDAAIDFDPISAIASLGYDNSSYTEGAWSFNCEAGIIYSGNPKMQVTNISGLAGKFVADDIKRELKSEFDDVKKYLRFYPIISFGVKYSF